MPANKPGRQTITLHSEQVAKVDKVLRRLKALGFDTTRNEAARVAIELSAYAAKDDDTVTEAMITVRMGR